MTTQTQFAWYRLFSAKGFGPKSIGLVGRRSREKGVDLERIFDMDARRFDAMFPELGRGRLSKAKFSSFADQDEDRLFGNFERLQRAGIELVTVDAPDYPSVLSRRMGDAAPPILFVKGPRSLLNADGYAVVGSRHPSEEGGRFARRLAADIAGEGKNVISGLARGTDSSAHEGALEAGGTTTAVLSMGVFTFMERETGFGNLAGKRSVLLASQCDPFAPWTAANAMARNAVVVGLSRGVVAVECGPEVDAEGRRSGTFDAAMTALKLAVPLFVVNPERLPSAPEGNAQLIKAGGEAIDPNIRGQELIRAAERREPEQTVHPTGQLRLL